MNNKVKTSVYLHKDIQERVKEAAEKRSGGKKGFSDWVVDAITSALANPDSLDPTKPSTEGEKILQKLIKAEKTSLKVQQKTLGDISDRLDSLEAKMDSIMEKFEVEQPVKDRSARRIFDDSEENKS